MNYRAWLNENKQAVIKTDKECLEYLETHCSRAWNSYLNDGLCFYRGSKRSIKNYEIWDPNGYQRISTSNGYLTTSMWDNLCDNTEYFKRSESVMFSRSKNHAAGFGTLLYNVFPCDRSIFNSTKEDFNKTDITDIFGGIKYSSTDVIDFNDVFWILIEFLCEKMLNDREIYADFYRDTLRKLGSNLIDHSGYYKLFYDFIIELSDKINKIDDYNNIMEKSLKPWVFDIVKSMRIDCGKLSTFFDNIKINKTGVSSLDAKGLCSLSYIAKEVWTTDPILMIDENTVKGLKYKI